MGAGGLLEEGIVRVGGEEEDDCSEFGASRRDRILLDEREGRLGWLWHRTASVIITFHFPWNFPYTA